MELIKHERFLQIRHLLSPERLEEVCEFIKDKQQDAQDVYFLDEHGFGVDEFDTQAIQDAFTEIDPSYRNYRRATQTKTILNYLGNNQSYPPHYDICAYVGCLWLRLGEFSGGEFVFNDFNKMIPIEHNSAAVFPAGLQHEVKTVRGEGRFSIARFQGITPHQWADDLKTGSGNYADLYC